MFDKNKLLVDLKKFVRRQEKMYPDMYPFVREHLNGIAQTEYMLKLWRSASPEAVKNCPPDLLKALNRAKGVARIWRLHKKVLRESRKKNSTGTHLNSHKTGVIHYE